MEAEAPVWCDKDRNPLKPEDLNALIVCAAHDAGLTDAARISAETLRHTYISRLVSSGASVKIAQELARHSSPTLTIGRYAHVQLASLSQALDNLPGASAEKEPESLRATGTDDVSPQADPSPPRTYARDPQQIPQHSGHGTIQSGATRCDSDINIPDPADEATTLVFAGDNDAVRGDATQRGNAPGRTRTSDPRFRKPVLYPTELRALEWRDLSVWGPGSALAAVAIGDPLLRVRGRW